MDPIKEAFRKIRQDINTLKESLEFIVGELAKVNRGVNEIKHGNNQKKAFDTSTYEFDKLDTSFDTSTHPSTQKGLFKPLNNKIQYFSTGNQGVSTDRQTDRQTDNSAFFSNSKVSIDEAAKILSSLDNIKKEIRLKFKKLTEQEFLIFSLIYQIEEEIGYADYLSISQKTGLTESSIRDYVGRLIKKGVSIEKKRVNNKNIHLFISKNLKKIATLQTILQLREI